MDRQVPNTLFPFPDIYIAQNKKNFGLIMSKEFVDCANAQLTPLFEKEVGFKVNKRVELCWVSPPYQEFFLRTNGLITELSSQIMVNTRNLPMIMAWKSKSGRMYLVSDTDIDCSDIEFWLEGIDPLEFNKLMFPMTSQPFKLKDLTYELIVERINLDCTIRLRVKEGVDMAKLFKEIDGFIGGYNERSEKNNRIDGVVHNWKYSQAEDEITYVIDLGSARAAFLKKLLTYFSKLGQFLKITVE
ncbi:hypothetical protein [Sediminibacterium ginsengisoli]|uniref:Uncharacterized protein n=1 Tax=Sediminibacterium ginsengisoli TaxID=413434 RepID=A0A1T4R4A6_9BACT|nr:hypothetical protein [Sediminibacterium ginsengisoli]SKA10870.1 hypothetical protein SAMN04488132_110127 [Sediminibacterium ginsengisoli]